MRVLPGLSTLTLTSFLCFAMATGARNKSTNPLDYKFKKEVGKAGFTDEEKIDILNLHNELRSNVEPPAANMNYLVNIL